MNEEVYLWDSIGQQKNNQDNKKNEKSNPYRVAS